MLQDRQCSLSHNSIKCVPLHAVALLSNINKYIKFCLSYTQSLLIRFYKEQLVEIPKSKERGLVEFEPLKEHLSSSTVKDSLFQGISELIKSLLKDYFKLHKTLLGTPRSCYLLVIP